MKKLLLIFCIISVVHFAQGQTNYTPTGNWKWINGTDTIQFYLKADQIQAAGQNFPVIIGFHKYIKNGVTIENSLQNSNSSYLNHSFSIILYNGSSDDKPRIDGDFKDLTINDKRYIMVTRINPTTMNIYITYPYGVRLKGTQGFTLPQHFTLTKQ